MLSLLGSPRSACDGWTRRETLRAGGAGLLGLSLPRLLAAEDSARAFTGGRAKSVIFLFLYGGPAQHETFDMKPLAGEKIRGPFKPITCRTPGLQICEHLPRLADVSDKFAVIRTMSHDFHDHSGGGHYIQTGKRWHIPIGGGFNATPQDWPSMGSVVEYLAQKESGGAARDLPSYAVLPNSLGKLEQQGQYIRPGEYPGWLGRGYSPLTTGIQKKDTNDNPFWRNCSDEELNYSIQGMAAPLELDRMNRRISLLQHFDESRRELDSRRVGEFSRFRERALALVHSDRVRTALDIQQESPALRDRYGRHLYGQSCLMARRLVEAGVRFCTVHYDCVDGYSWDSHLNSNDVRDHLLPTFDQSLATLLSDLDERGLLDETLVVALGEMGRTPQATATWGRQHWATCFPAVIAGAGIQGGTTYGTSDEIAAYPKDHIVHPEDLAATIYWALGIDPETRLPEPTGRPVNIVENGEVQRGLFG